MGRDVPAITINRIDKRMHRDKVRKCLYVLDRMLSESKFESGANRVGLEIEFSLVDGHGLAAWTNADVLAAVANPAWALELGQFNIEFCGEPVILTGDVFATLECSVGRLFAQAAERAESLGNRMAMVGILPSLRDIDIGPDALSPNPRFLLLNDQIMAARGEEISISIDGPDPLRTYSDNIMYEAACTSVQCHLQVSPASFASYWNAAESIASVQVALAANAPFLLGHQLWAETRIALFKQAIDTRSEELRQQGVRPRVWFGEQWISSASELFEENLRYFPALLPLCEDDDPELMLDVGEVPDLAELALHNGTVYRWNRPIYGVTGGKPHLRIENRVLPSGPTLVDVLANAAFYYGLVHELALADRPVWSRMSFATAAANLTAGARHGLDAELYWPGLGMIAVTELTLSHLLPLAASGLARWGVDAADASRLLSIIEQRCVTGQNGASWQVRAVRDLEERGARDRAEALRLMTQGYLERMNTKEPVHTWPGM
jgi:hypothetical protein